jgi:hypothetical protein
VGGNFLMQGTSLTDPGAVISSSNSGSGTGVAGDIRIKVGNVIVNPDELTITCDTTPAGDIVVENGAQILADALDEAGLHQDVRGQERHDQRPGVLEGHVDDGRGGPITIDACCDLVVGDTAGSSARARMPGPTWCICRACVVKISGWWSPAGPGTSCRSTISAT